MEIVELKFPIKAYKHILTHQTLFGQFYEVKVDGISEVMKPYVKVKTIEVATYALPVLLTNHLKDNEKTTLF